MQQMVATASGTDDRIESGQRRAQPKAERRPEGLLCVELLHETAPQPRGLPRPREPLADVETPADSR